MFCPHCFKDHNYWIKNEDQDDVCGCCSFVDYAKIPEDIIISAKGWRIGETKEIKYPDKGCKLATREIRRRTNGKIRHSHCLECPFPDECIEIRVNGRPGKAVRV